MLFHIVKTDFKRSRHTSGVSRTEQRKSVNPDLDFFSEYNLSLILALNDENVHQI